MQLTLSDTHMCEPKLSLKIINKQKCYVFIVNNIIYISEIVLSAGPDIRITGLGLLLFHIYVFVFS